MRFGRFFTYSTREVFQSSPVANSCVHCKEKRQYQFLLQSCQTLVLSTVKSNPICVPLLLGLKTPLGNNTSHHCVCHSLFSFCLFVMLLVYYFTCMDYCNKYCNTVISQKSLCAFEMICINLSRMNDHLEKKSDLTLKSHGPDNLVNL